MVADQPVIALGPEHIGQCVDLHLQAFPEFFLSQLGPRFLTEFYRAFIDDPDALTGVVVDQGLVRGVVVGSIRPDGFFSRLLKRRWFAFAWASLASVVRQPMMTPRLLRAVRYRGGVPIDVDGALLSSICVAPEAQGRGVGAALIHHFAQGARQAGMGAYLVTDKVDNQATNVFYLRQGWRLAGSYRTPEGRAMNCYILDISEVKR